MTVIRILLLEVLVHPNLLYVLGLFRPSAVTPRVLLSHRRHQ